MNRADAERFFTDPLFEPERRFIAHERHKRWLDMLLDCYRWYRRRRGGHWEQWIIDAPVAAVFWFPMATCTRGTDARPPLGRGTPFCEDY